MGDNLELAEKCHGKAMAYYERWLLGKNDGKDGFAIFPAALYEKAALQCAIDAGVGEPSIGILRESVEILTNLANAQ